MELYTDRNCPGVSYKHLIHLFYDYKRVNWLFNVQRRNQNLMVINIRSDTVKTNYTKFTKSEVVLGKSTVFIKKCTSFKYR